MRPFAEVGHLEGLEIHDENATCQPRVRFVRMAVLGAVVAAHEEEVRLRQHARASGAGELVRQSVEAIASVER